MADQPEDDIFLIVAEGVKKQKILGPGKGPTPTTNAHVQVHYSCCLLDGTLVDSTFDSNPLCFLLGQGQVIPGLEAAILSMRVGERSLFHVSYSQGYGRLGCPPLVPPHADIAFDILLVSFEETELKKDMPIEERISKAFMDKEEGNRHFKEENMYQAAQCYKRGINRFTSVDEDTLDKETKEAWDKVQIPLRTNLAACQLHSSEISNAIENCKQVLQVDRHNVKALFRLGKAYLALNEYHLATRALFKAAKINPKDKKIRKLLEEAREKHTMHQCNEKTQWGKTTIQE